jgi:hypothetical protein
VLDIVLPIRWRVGVTGGGNVRTRKSEKGDDAYVSGEGKMRISQASSQSLHKEGEEVIGLTSDDLHADV